MYINSVEEKEISSQATISSSNYGSRISKGFLMSLQDQMTGWIKAITDNKITSKEVAAIEQGSIDNLNSADDTSDVLYNDSAAYFLASTKINDVSNAISFLFSSYSVENQMIDKVLSMLKG